MNEMTVFQEDDDKTVVSLARRREMLKVGGKEPPIEGNWLSTLMPGTEFVTQDKTQQFPWLLREWALMGHKGGVSCLAPALTQNDPNSWMWVDPEEFSKAFRLRAITEEP